MPKLGIPPSRFPDRQPIAELRLQTAACCRTSVRPPPSPADDSALAARTQTLDYLVTPLIYS